MGHPEFPEMKAEVVVVALLMFPILDFQGRAGITSYYMGFTRSHSVSMALALALSLSLYISRIHW